MRPRILPGYPALLLPAALLAALLIFISKVSIVREYGNNTPFWDQWDAEAEQLYKPYKQGRLGLSSILRTHNEHRITTTRILHLGLFVLTGCKWTPKLQMHVNALLHVSAISLFLAFTCWAVPTRVRLPVWIAGTLLFLVPFGWDNVLQGFNTHFYTLLFSILLRGPTLDLLHRTVSFTLCSDCNPFGHLMRAHDGLRCVGAGGRVCNTWV